jgi:hypothetical protein
VGLNEKTSKHIKRKQRNKETNKQASKPSSKLMSKHQRNTNTDICDLQCRLFFVWSDAVAAAIAWGLWSRASVI